MKNMLDEFKEFALKGSLIELRSPSSWPSPSARSSSRW